MTLKEERIPEISVIKAELSRLSGHRQLTGCSRSNENQDQGDRKQ